MVDLPAGSRFIDQASPDTWQRLVLGQMARVSAQGQATHTWERSENLIIAHKFEDKNFDGLQQEDESSLANWGFTLKTPGGQFSATTDANGNAFFSGVIVDNGSYILTETLQAGWSSSTPASQTRVRSTGDPWMQWRADFGNGQYSILEILKYLDADGDGVWDVDQEPLLPGWQFALYMWKNGDWAQHRGGTTGSNGRLVFTDLVSGRYKAVEQAANHPGYINTTPLEQEVTLGYPVRYAMRFGNRGALSISGIKFSDLDADGTRDAGEPALPGWTIRLTGGPHPLDLTTTTAGDGRYTFANLEPGNYALSEIAQAGWRQTWPGGVGSHAVTLVDKAADGVDFGNTQLACLGDYVWLDQNRNGIQNSGEQGVPGVRTELFQQTGGAWISQGTQQTAANGRYEFCNLVAGSYYVRFYAPAGYQITMRDQGSDDTTDSDADPTTGATVSIMLKAGEHQFQWDAGLYLLPAIALEKYVSVDNQVTWDAADAAPGPSAVAGSDVYFRFVVTNSGAVALSDVTLTDNVFDLSSCPAIPNPLPVDAVYACNYGPVAAISGQHTNRASVIGTYSTIQVSATDDANYFGQGCIQEVHGRVWRDMDRNKTMDDQEPAGLAKILVALLDGTQPGRPVVQQTHTDDNGYYSFEGMAPGRYYVDVDDGYLASEPTLRLFLTTPEDEPVLVQVGACATAGVNFGFGPLEAGKGALGNFLWYDTNGNGKQDEWYDANGDDAVNQAANEWIDANSNGKLDEGEALKCPLRLVTVKLYSGGGVLLATTYTDYYGFYAFYNLAAGQYRIIIDRQDPAWVAASTGYQVDRLCKTIVPADLLGYISGPPSKTQAANAVAGASPAAGSDAPLRFSPAAVALAGARSLPAAAPAAADAASISGQVRVDRNANGNLLDADEGLDGVKVGLWRDEDGSGLKNLGDTLVVTTTTAGGGAYSFPGLGADDYVILAEDLIVDNTGDPVYGYASTADSDGANDNQIAIKIGANDNSTGNDFLDVLVHCTMTNPFDLISLGPGEINLGIDVYAYCAANLPAMIGDYVWYDSNGDGVQNVGEPGLANVRLTLYLDTDASGTLTMADTAVMTQTTDADGGYLFKDLPAGTYFVDVTDAANPNGPLNGLAHTSGPQGQTDPFGPITLANEQVYKDADFGYVKRPEDGKAIVGDTVWYDDNGDAVQQPGEPGIPNVTVIIRDASGNAIGSAVTDSNGHYRVEVPAGSGYTAAPDPNTVPANLSATTSVPANLPPLTAGQQYLEADFGYDDEGLNLLGEIGNLVWLDTDKDGIVGTGELPLPGVSVDLIRDTNNDGVWQQSEPIIATVTSGNTLDAQTGNYLFTGVPQGHYLVHVSDTNAILADFSKSPVVNGIDHVNRTDPYPVYLATAGANDYGADFAYFKPNLPGSGLIGNQVWIETESLISTLDGLFDPRQGDFGQPGVTIELLSTSGQVLATTTTGASGDYSFLHLPAGDYQVQVSDAQGVLIDYDPTSLGPNPSQDNNNQQQPYTVALASAGYNLTADFGYANLGGQTTASYTIIKRLNGVSPLRSGSETSFTIQIINTSTTAWITHLPLRDEYDTSYLGYLRAEPTSLDNVNDGVINWRDLTETFWFIAPGRTVTIVVYFTALNDTTALPDKETPNTATVYNAWADGDGPAGPKASALSLPEQPSTDYVGIYTPTGVELVGFERGAGRRRDRAGLGDEH